MRALKWKKESRTKANVQHKRAHPEEGKKEVGSNMRHGEGNESQVNHEIIEIVSCDILGDACHSVTVQTKWKGSKDTGNKNANL